MHLSSLTALPAAVFLLLVTAQSHAQIPIQMPQEMPKEDVMCALPKVPQKCPIWTENGYKRQGPNGAPDMQKPFDPLLSQQDVPCTSQPATCWSQPGSGYSCDYSKGMWAKDMMQEDKWYELKPGSPAVCAHGNREFSFLATRRYEDKKLVIMLTAGGICWDAKTCGDPQARQVSVDALRDPVPSPGTGTTLELAPTVPRALRYAPLSDSGRAAFETGLLRRCTTTTPQNCGTGGSNFFGKWSAVVVPDCTGDLHVGNRSYTYDRGTTSCITAHHKGSVNTGEAMKWVVKNFVNPTHILLVGTGQPASKATGGHAVIFWASYLSSMFPNAIVRTVTDGSLGVSGPRLQGMLKDDPWGTVGARIPNWDKYPLDETDPEGLLRLAPNGGFLMPPPSLWNVADDSVSDAYRLMAQMIPTAAFADVAQTQDPIQKQWFRVTGGKDLDCCLDGCGCHTAQPYGVRGGRLDWTKKRKVEVLQRQTYQPNNYRSWISDSDNHFVLLHEAAFSGGAKGAGGVVPATWKMLTSCTMKEEPSITVSSLCPDNNDVTGKYVATQKETTLHDFLMSFAVSSITYANSLNEFTKRTETQATTTLPISRFCQAGCLDNVLGSSRGSEKCNMTWGAGENFFTVAPQFKTDWMTLWSLNGGDEPDNADVGAQYRFAHEYLVQAGETMESIAERFGTTVEHLLALNQNLITNVHNPRRVGKGDVVCVVPSFHNTMDQMGLPVCPSDRQTFGDEPPPFATPMPP